MKTLLSAIAGVIALSSTAMAAPSPIREAGKFGIGFGTGTIANGLSAKYYMAKTQALQFNLGTFGGGGIDNRFGNFDGLGLSADYLWEMPTIVRAGDAFDLGWNIGAGVGLGFDNFGNDNHFALAASFVLGLEFNFIPVPIDIVIEYRPGLLIVPDVHFDAVDFSAHIRYYF